MQPEFTWEFSSKLFASPPLRLARRLLGKLYRRYLSSTYALKERFARPVQVSINKKARVRLLPEGQIARYLHGGSFESVERRLVACYLKRGMTVIDIGANIGLYSLIAE